MVLSWAGDAILLIVSGVGLMNIHRNKDLLKVSFITFKVMERLKALSLEFDKKKMNHETYFLA